MLYGGRPIIMRSKIYKQKKNTQRMSQIMRNLQVHMKCWTILTYSNVVGIFWTYLTWHMNKRVWPPKKKNTVQICYKLWLNIIIFQRHHCQKINFDKRSIILCQKRKLNKKMPNIMPTMLQQTLLLSPPLRSIH